MSDAAYVYIIAHERDGMWCAPVKLGYSKNPHDRLAALRTANPSKLVLAWAFYLPAEYAHMIERALHKIYVEEGIGGEWFDIHPARAMWEVALNIRSFFKHVCGFSAEEIDEYAETIGLSDCRSVLRKLGYLVGPPGDEKVLH